MAFGEQTRKISRTAKYRGLWFEFADFYETCKNSVDWRIIIIEAQISGARVLSGVQIKEIPLYSDSSRENSFSDDSVLARRTYPVLGELIIMIMIMITITEENYMNMIVILIMTTP